MKRLLFIAALVLLASPAWAAIFAPASGSPDTFNGTAGTELHAYDPDWVDNTNFQSSTYYIQISNPAGYAQLNTTSYNAVYFYNVSSPSDYTVQADCYVISNAAYSYDGGVAARVSASAATAYYVIGNVSGTAGSVTWELIKDVSGTKTTLATYAGTINNGSTYTIVLTVQGTSLTVTINGTQIISASDSAISSGYPGIITYSQGWTKLTNWSANGNIATRRGIMGSFSGSGRRIIH